MLGSFPFVISVLAHHPVSDVAEFADLLGLPSAHVRRRGGGKYGSSRCLIELSDNTVGTIADCLRQAIVTLTPHRHYIQRLHASGGYVEVFIRWYPNGDTGESLAPDILRDLAGLGLTLGFNVYGVSP